MNKMIDIKDRIIHGTFPTVKAGLLLLCLASDQGLAQTYRILHTFTGPDGADPLEGRLLLSSNTLYGVTYQGGISNYGILFRVNTDGSGYTVLKSFTGGSDGRYPLGELCLSGGSLYGTTQSGGISDRGTVYKVNTNGSWYTVLKHFGQTDARCPCGGLLLSGSTLYGTTESGGDSGYGGTVFRVNTDGSGFAVLKSFDLSWWEGAHPNCTLILSGTALYGTTLEGYSSVGGVFRINTDGSGYTVLKVLSVSGGDGQWPVSPVLLVNGMLYGTTVDGGERGYGRIFQVSTDGAGFRVLKSFNGSSDGAILDAGLLLSGGMLYGTAVEGGDYPYLQGYGHGTVFRINTDGSGFRVLKQFTGSDGANPYTSLIMSGTTLYGMTGSGGSSNRGVIFSLVTTQTAVVPPQSQTAEIGSEALFSVRADNLAPTVYTWWFNNVVVSECANPFLRLTNIQPWQAGAYTVAISNTLSAATSAPAMLSVIPPVARRPVPALSLAGLQGTFLNLDCAQLAASPPNWQPLDCVALSSTPQLYFDVSTPLPPQRYYRAWHTNDPATIPALSLKMVPALTLAGATGSSLRVDYINAIGPTDAWITLDSVVLTNTTQLYFDLSAWGQPARLYRLVLLP